MAADPSLQARQAPPKFMNNLMTFMLRSPLHGMMSKFIMLISFRGRKSGKLYTIPVGYMQQGKTVTLFTDHNWWKNLRNNATVTLHIQGKDYQGTTEAIHNQPDIIAPALAEFVQKNSRAAQAYGITLNAAKQPDPESVQRFTLVRVQLL